VSAGGVTQREAIPRPEGAGPAARPGWLKSRRPAGPPPLLADPAPVVAVEPSDAPPRRRGVAAVVAWVRQTLAYLYLGWGMTVSLVVHAILLTVLALIVLHRQSREDAQVFGVFGKPADETVLDLPLNSKLDQATGSEAAPLEFVASTVVSDSAAMLATSDRILGAIDGDKQDAGEGDTCDALGAMSDIRVPESAITKGSFTVWTEPEDPLPRQRYFIVIQVQLPKTVKQYRLRDLTGEVHGTDGYYKKIWYSATERKGVKNGVVQLQIPIPGAVQLIKDTIRIKSELLKEEQTIEIVF